MRKAFFLLIHFFLLLNAGFSQPNKSVSYWQQEVNHDIDVSLNTEEHTLDGFERIVYTNHSPDTLHFIWFHIWPNAFKNDRTAFSEQLLKNGNTAFYFSAKEDKGYINRLEFKINDITAQTEDHPEHIDIIKVMLPVPLLPGNSVEITTPFHIKLPYNFSRGGHVDQQYQVTQWYPKPAVYDAHGWHPMPYLDQGEFYNEFGNYDVRITLPADYVVAATGVLQDEKEKHWMLNREAPKNEINKSLRLPKGNVTGQKLEAPISTSFKTLHFKQENVTDFAWVASTHLIVKNLSVPLNNKNVEAFIFFPPGDEDLWKNSFETIANTLTTRSQWIGEYPYQTVNIVSGPQGFTGGMEYPGFTIISGIQDSSTLAMLIEHEIGHNWFQSILANNERKQPWLDEGVNTYYGNRYEEWVSSQSKQIHKQSTPDYSRILFETQARQKLDQPANSSSEDLSAMNYNIIPYYKAAAIIKKIEEYIGREDFDNGMQRYFLTKKFQHVTPTDMQTALETTSGKNLDSLFDLFTINGLLPGKKIHGWKVVTPLDINKLKNEIFDKNILLISPALGANYYDKLMIGGLISNYKLPPTKLQFFVAPMYGTGSGKLTGLSKLNYSLFPGKHFRKIDLFVNAAKFSMNEFTDSQDNKTVLSFTKLVPGVRFTLPKKDPLSNIHSYIQWKTYFIHEDQFRFYQDSLFAGGDTIVYPAVRTTGKKRTLHQLSLSIENFRTLYPYDLEVKLEHGKNFVRSALTANYFFNYGVEGGMDVRFFAGKFLYTGNKTIAKQFETDRYHLNMTGANGYEDYTYSDYFVGRNEFEGFANQQMMIRDGGFKVRTDLLAEKTGKTDDWLMAVNFSTTIPESINPLQVLPVKIPLKIYADAGTYAGAWEKDAESDRFLFNAGLQISLFKNVLNIYMPVLYSNVYKDYIQSTIDKKGRFFKTISFSIDFSQVKTSSLSEWISL
ncbi:MAG: M1 family metallopeptidase [Chitinophagaceae bacterium]|nr:M1 family metallopeptidase [Chitinophagaceae bacterium]